MILQRLDEYYERLHRERPKEIPRFGFQKKELPFIVEFDREGIFVQIIDTRQKVGKKLVGQQFLVPAEKGRSGKNSWQVANLLWDHPGYLLGINPKNPETGRKQHESFVKQIKDIFGEEPDDEAIAAALRFLEQNHLDELEKDEHWEEILKRMPFMGLKLQGDDRLVAQHECVSRFVEQELKEENRSFCPVRGQEDTPARLHPKIKGVWGTQSSGAALVSFNLSAFNSYGKSQGANAPIGEQAAFAYTTALNFLLSDERHLLHMGDLTVVFWSRQPHEVETIVKNFFGTASPQSASEDTERIKMLFKAPWSGVQPNSEDETPFYVLGLSPNAARISVRFWYEGSAGKTLQNIRRHFEDLSIVKRFENEPDLIPLGRLLLSTALEGKWDNVPPNLAGALFMAAINGGRYPDPLLSAAIRRIRAEAGKKDRQTDKRVEFIPYERAALLKALLIRNHHKEIPMSLDPTRNDPAYVLGRLFAVLENLQSRAQGKLNASIR
jgi:CRISPR-associated protein Csd1